MAKHLNKHNINAIVNLIRGWEESKLTWAAICEAATQIIGKMPTRQSLNMHEEIMLAYKAKKGKLKDQVPQKPRPASLNIAADRIANLEAEIAELKEQNRRYKQMFTEWQYNTYKLGLKEYQLNKPLPNIDRERTYV